MDQTVFSSDLKEAIQRALSRWLASAFMLEIITYADLVKHYGIMELITSLSPEVRGKVHCACSGGGDPARIAKVDPESVAVMISSMLKGHVVDEKLICKEITTDHMVEVLANDRLYALVFGRKDEARPWNNSASDACATFMSRAHQIIHAERVLEPDEYVSILEEQLVHEKTPAGLLVAGQRDAIALHRDGKTFSGERFIEIYTPEAIVQYVELEKLFPAIEAVAKRHGWVKNDESEKAPENPDASSTENAGSGLPREALDSIPPAASDTKAPDEDGEPEISVSGLTSVPPADGADADDDGIVVDELVDDELDRAYADAGGPVGSSSPPPLGKRRRQKHAGG